MYNIYCMIHPDTKRPFYVGATKTSIYNRLSWHMRDARRGDSKWWNEKDRFIAHILHYNKTPKARLLKIVSLNEVDFYEEFFYRLLKQQGFTLLQKESGFLYKKKVDTMAINERKYQQLRQYSQLRYKNILIIIW